VGCDRLQLAPTSSLPATTAGSAPGQKRTCRARPRWLCAWQTTSTLSGRFS
jgi:hypothetical protein